MAKGAAALTSAAARQARLTVAAVPRAPNVELVRRRRLGIAVALRDARPSEELCEHVGLRAVSTLGCRLAGGRTAVLVSVGIGFGRRKQRVPWRLSVGRLELCLGLGQVEALRRDRGVRAAFLRSRQDGGGRSDEAVQSEAG